MSPSNPTQAHKVAFLDALRRVVGRRVPLNHVGVPLVSDYDLIWSTPEEREEAWRNMRQDPNEKEIVVLTPL